MAANAHHVQAHHFLMVTIAAQGQINPARHLARRLARFAEARVTLATPLYSHRRLFPGSLTAAGEPDDMAEEGPLNTDGSGVVAYAPYSDGFDEGVHMDEVEADVWMERFRSTGPGTLSTLIRNFAQRGRPVTCVLHTILLTWASDLARDHNIPAFHYWIQPASVFAIYYHYFQGHQSFTSEEKGSSYSIELPGLPSLRKKDLPSTMVTEPNSFLSAHKEIFIELGRYDKPKVLVNTFYQLEAPVIDKIPEFEMITIGPVVDKSFVAETAESRDLFEEDPGGYMEWLDSQEEQSVVYVAFGSLWRLTRRQVEELDVGLKKSGRPYLWVLRRDSRPEGFEVERILKEGEGKGKVVEWCSQVRVLDHKAVGCFVTHGGWNSTSEALLSGVPMVMLPQWIEQATNARLAEAAWGIGVRAEAGEDGLVEAAELRRGLDVVLGKGERAKEIRRKAEEWKEKAKAALAVDGSSCTNLKAFVSGL